jgi:hypothetical protein
MIFIHVIIAILGISGERVVLASPTETFKEAKCLKIRYTIHTDGNQQPSRFTVYAGTNTDFYMSGSPVGRSESCSYDGFVVLRTVVPSGDTHIMIEVTLGGITPTVDVLNIFIAPLNQCSHPTAGMFIQISQLIYTIKPKQLLILQWAIIGTISRLRF